MRLVRYAVASDAHYGLLASDHVRPLFGDPFGEFQLADDSLPLAGLKLLPPVIPGKILAVGLNYRSHLMGREAPTKPEMFWKPPSAIVGPGAEIVLPADSQDVHAEGELVVVIGKHARNLSPEQAMDVVFGYTIGNDVSERVWQKDDRQWWRAKGCDTFAPIGPEVVTDRDWRGFNLTTQVNGRVVQSGALADLLFDVPTVVAFASHYVSLAPGDLIFTGTPGNTCTLHPGDNVTVAVPGIGILANRVVAAR